MVERMGRAGVLLAVVGVLLLVGAVRSVPAGWSFDHAAEWMLTAGFAVIGVGFLATGLAGRSDASSE